MKLFTAALLLMLSVFSNQSFSKSPGHKIGIYFDTVTVQVGTKINDSTGQLTISATSIQQTIVPTISSLNGMTLTTSQSPLLVNPTTAYLMMNGTNSSGNAVLVAIQLKVDGANLIYIKDGHHIVHICKKTGSCTSCEFFKLGNIIISCKCPNQGYTNPTEGPCVDQASDNK